MTAAESLVGCGAVVLLIVFAAMRSKIYCDCPALWKGSTARLEKLLSDRRVSGGGVMTAVGLYLMFLGVEHQEEAEASSTKGEDAEFESEVLRTHRTWFTRGHIMRSLAMVMFFNLFMHPLQATAGEAIESQLAYVEAGWHTAMVAGFVVMYLLSWP